MMSIVLVLAAVRIPGKLDEGWTGVLCDVNGVVVGRSGRAFVARQSGQSELVELPGNFSPSDASMSPVDSTFFIGDQQDEALVWWRKSWHRFKNVSTGYFDYNGTLHLVVSYDQQPIVPAGVEGLKYVLSYESMSSRHLVKYDDVQVHLNDAIVVTKNSGAGKVTLDGSVFEEAPFVSLRRGGRYCYMIQHSASKDHIFQKAHVFDLGSAPHVKLKLARRGTSWLVQAWFADKDLVCATYYDSRAKRTFTDVTSLASMRTWRSTGEAYQVLVPGTGAVVRWGSHASESPRIVSLERIKGN